MKQRLSEIDLRFSELEAKLSSNAVASQEEYRRLIKEYNELLPLANAYRALCRTQNELCEAVAVREDPHADEELRVLAAEEEKEKRQAVGELEDQIRLLLLPKDENDQKNAIVEIRAGAGGEEAALFVSDLYRMYRMYADASGLSLELLGCNETELGGFREIIFRVFGSDVYKRLKYESGVHRVQRVPRTESSGRIHTSTVTVAVLPEVEDEGEVELNPADLVIESMKSSGAGGQHINKTESAVRILHVPTGIVVACQTQRSQLQNKEAALRMLRSKLSDIQRREQQERTAADRKSQIGTGDRSEKIRTYNFPQGRITDHRIGFSIYTLEAFLNGDIGAMIEALMMAETTEKLKNYHD